MSDTPETDAERWIYSYPEYHETAQKYVSADFARKLERERDEAREEAHRFRSLHYSHLGINKSASWFAWEGNE